jgi:hypothetical protein
MTLGKIEAPFSMPCKYPYKMTTSTSYSARDIDRVEECVKLFFNIREVDRQMIAAKIIESNGAYDPAIPYEGYWTTMKLSPEDRCLVARHVQEGDQGATKFSDMVSRVPKVRQLHIAAVKEEWLRVKDDEEEPMCTYCGCDPNVEDHLHDCESLPCNQGYEEEDHPHPCKHCDGTYGEHHRDCEMVKSDRM